MGGFSYSVKTDKSRDYFTVMAWGTLRRMLEFAKVFDGNPETVESRIVRERDGKVVRHYEKKAL